MGILKMKRRKQLTMVMELKGRDGQDTELIFSLSHPFLPLSAVYWITIHPKLSDLKQEQSFICPQFCSSGRIWCVQLTTAPWLKPGLVCLEEMGAGWTSLFLFIASHPPEGISLPLFLCSLSFSCRAFGLLDMVAGQKRKLCQAF